MAKKKILQCIGTRPNLIKFINITGKDIVIYTGQHYDKALFALEKPKIDYDIDKTELGCMIEKIEEIMRDEKPDCVVVYGDTRSALAGALASNELDIPLAHIEAGCRLNDMSRPEERIRRMIDHISDYLFCPTQTAVDNLRKESVKGSVYLVGDLHYDRYVQNREHGNYILATIHRAEHTDNKQKLKEVLKKLECKETVVFPIHPRTKGKIKGFKLKLPKNVKVIEPLSYKEMLHAIKWAKRVITDSGGVSREAWFSGTPVTVIGESEWPEIKAFGEGNAGEKIREILFRG